MDLPLLSQSDDAYVGQLLTDNFVSVNNVPIVVKNTFYDVESAVLPTKRRCRSAPARVISTCFALKKDGLFEEVNKLLLSMGRLNERNDWLIRKCYCYSCAHALYQDALHEWSRSIVANPIAVGVPSPGHVQKLVLYLKTTISSSCILDCLQEEFGNETNIYQLWNEYGAPQILTMRAMCYILSKCNFGARHGVLLILSNTYDAIYFLQSGQYNRIGKRKLLLLSKSMLVPVFYVGILNQCVVAWKGCLATRVDRYMGREYCCIPVYIKQAFYHSKVTKHDVIMHVCKTCTYRGYIRKHFCQIDRPGACTTRNLPMQSSFLGNDHYQSSLDEYDGLLHRRRSWSFNGGIDA